MTNLTPADLSLLPADAQEAYQLACAATEEPWHWRPECPEEYDEPTALLAGDDDYVVILMNRGSDYREDLRMDITKADRDHIANARTSVPALVELAVKLTKERDELKVYIRQEPARREEILRRQQLRDEADVWEGT